MKPALPEVLPPTSPGEGDAHRHTRADWPGERTAGHRALDLVRWREYSPVALTSSVFPTGISIAGVCLLGDKKKQWFFLLQKKLN